MEFSTYNQMKAIEYIKDVNSINEQKKFKETKLPSSFVNTNTTKNVLLDKSIRNLFEEFILCWNKIILDLLSPDLYKDLDETKKDWWEMLFNRILKILSVFLVKERIMHIGIGLIIASFFVFFILATN